MKSYLFVFTFSFIRIVYTQDYSPQFLQTYSDLNGVCRSAKDCRPFGYVCKNNKTCDCAEMYRSDVYKKQCVGGVDQRCLYDEHCIEGAYCMNQEVCRCKETTPVILDEGMVCAKSNIPNTFISVFYLVLFFIITII